MRSDQLDIALAERDGEIFVRLGGDLEARHIPAVREKLFSLFEEPGRTYILDLEQVRFLDEGYLNLLVDLLNGVNGREGKLVLLFSKADTWKLFRPFANIFSIYPTYSAWKQSGFLANLRRTGVAYSRKTGIRVSTGVALFLGILIMGWMLTLFTIIRYQEGEIRNREERVLRLEQTGRDYVREITILRRAIGPLRELGLVGDSLRNLEYESIGDWVEYLEKLESRRVRDQGNAGEQIP